MFSYELLPLHTHQRSFYKKAWVYVGLRVINLKSYETTVCRIITGVGDINFPRAPHSWYENFYSNTSNRHIWDFLLQEDENIANIYRDICKKEKIKSFKQFRMRIKTFNLKTGEYVVRK